MMRRWSRRNQDRLVRAIAAGLVLGSAVIAVKSVTSVRRFVAPSRTPVAESRPAEPMAVTARNLAALWQRDLRQPLVDLPKPAPAVVADTPLPIQLIGTAIEPQRRFGVFAVSNRSVIREVGAEIEGYRVAAIERGSARLEKAERSIELRVPWYEKLRRTLEPADGKP